MKKESFYYRVEESVATITFTDFRGDKAHYPQTTAGFEDVIKKVISDSSVRVVIISGKEVFCPGTSYEGREPVTRNSFCSIIDKIDLPVVAAIKGNAFGQGLELALACDLRFCSKGAHFAMPQIIMGEIPWDGGTQRLSRLVGRGKAMEMILTGESIDAGCAGEIGLVNRVVDPEDLMATVMETAQDMASKGPIALRYAKEAICKGMDLTLDQGLRLEADLYFLLHTTMDRIEGIKAFQEKRDPKFERR